MNNYIVIFETDDADVHNDIIKYLNMFSWGKLASNAYVIRTDRAKPSNVRDEINAFTKEAKCRLMVFDYNNGIGWASNGIPDDVTSWLKKIH